MASFICDGTHYMSLTAFRQFAIDDLVNELRKRDIILVDNTRLAGKGAFARITRHPKDEQIRTHLKFVPPLTGNPFLD